MTIRSLLASAVILAPLAFSAAPTRADEPAYTIEVREGPSLPYGVAAHAGGVVGNTPVIAAGSGWSDDKKTKIRHRETLLFVDGAWKTGPPLPSELSDCAFACDRSGFYIAGGTDGKTPSAQVLRLTDARADAKWQKLADLPEAIESSAGAIIDGKFYVAGGFSGGRASNHLSSLDVSRADAAWKCCADLPASGRAYPALLAHQGKLYLLGGYAGPPVEKETQIFADAFRYDPHADAWEKAVGFNFPGFGWCAVAVDNDHVLLAGRIDEQNKIRDEISLVNLRDPKPITVGKLVTPACCMTAIPAGEMSWWFVGGEPDAGRSRTPRVSVVRLLKR